MSHTVTMTMPSPQAAHSMLLQRDVNAFILRLRQDDRFTENEQERLNALEEGEVLWVELVELYLEIIQPAVLRDPDFEEVQMEFFALFQRSGISLEKAIQDYRQWQREYLEIEAQTIQMLGRISLEFEEAQLHAAEAANEQNEARRYMRAQVEERADQGIELDERLHAQFQRATGLDGQAAVEKTEREALAKQIDVL